MIAVHGAHPLPTMLRAMTWLSKVFGRAPKNVAQSSSKLDALTRQHLAKAGGDLNKPTDVVNYLYLPDEPKAQQAAAELRAAGYAVEVRPAATGNNWLARANIDMVPSHENIALIRERFEALASRLGGEYDGWEAAVTN